MLRVSTKIMSIFETIFSVENKELSRSIQNQPTWSLLPLKYEHNRHGSTDWMRTITEDPGSYVIQKQQQYG